VVRTILFGRMTPSESSLDHDVLLFPPFLVPEQEGQDPVVSFPSLSEQVVGTFPPPFSPQEETMLTIFFPFPEGNGVTWRPPLQQLLNKTGSFPSF